MTPDDYRTAAALAADLGRVLDGPSLERLGTDAACVVAPALHALLRLLTTDEAKPVDYSQHDLGAARFPGLHHTALYSDPIPVLTSSCEAANPRRVFLFDARPHGENGSLGLGRLVTPSDALADTIELLGGAPMLSDPNRPRQCQLRLFRLGEDDALVLTVRFRQHLLTVRREGESNQLTAGRTAMRSGLKVDVVGVYPTWPRTYRVFDHRMFGFDRYFIVTAEGYSPGDPHADQAEAQDKSRTEGKEESRVEEDHQVQ